MILPDHAITRAIESHEIAVMPFVPAAVQPSSIDVRLADTFRLFNNQAEVIDPRAVQSLTHEVIIGHRDYFVLHPGEFVLGATVEHFTLPSDMAAQLGGKSSLGRLGIQVHATAGWIDPGFSGNITLELSNVARMPVRLYPGMWIGQVVFLRLESPAERPYGHPSRRSKYVGPAAQGVVESHFHRNYEES